ncbi:MAG: ATP-binding protein [Nitrospira sp.]|nr:ATP-binding protein [Nitrospira sp.]
MTLRKQGSEEVGLECLVTHNTAILGILGVGKSTLALELVERMMANKIKVICLDLTNQYASELSPYYDMEVEKESLGRLQAVGQAGKAKVEKNVEEGGSRQTFAKAIAEELIGFLKPETTARIKIYNPAQFEVWRQDSKPFNNTASMASLTPAEITNIISDATLQAVSGLGMTDRARVCLVYEEAHSLVPEWNSSVGEGDRTAANGTARAILQGRKYGLGCLLITQRTANVTKTILNQCNTVFAMRTFDDTGKDFLANYLGREYANVLSTLQERQAVFFGRSSSCENPVLIQLNDRGDFTRVFRSSNPPPSLAGVETPSPV